MSSQSDIGGQDVAERLRQLQEERRLSIAEMAEAAGISKNSLQNYMRRNNPQKPGLDAVSKICSGLAVSADWLLGLGGQMARSSEAGSNVETAAKLVFWQHLEGLNRVSKLVAEQELDLFPEGKLYGAEAQDLAADLAYQVLSLWSQFEAGAVHPDGLTVKVGKPDIGVTRSLNPRPHLPSKA